MSTFTDAVGKSLVIRRHSSPSTALSIWKFVKNSIVQVSVSKLPGATANLPRLHKLPDCYVVIVNECDNATVNKMT